jgi:hypothetical protein
MEPPWNYNPSGAVRFAQFINNSQTINELGHSLIHDRCSGFDFFGLWSIPPTILGVNRRGTPSALSVSVI